MSPSISQLQASVMQLHLFKPVNHYFVMRDGTKTVNISVIGNQICWCVSPKYNTSTSRFQLTDGYKLMGLFFTVNVVIIDDISVILFGNNMQWVSPISACCCKHVKRNSISRTCSYLVQCVHSPDKVFTCTYFCIHSYRVWSRDVFLQQLYSLIWERLFVCTQL